MELVKIIRSSSDRSETLLKYDYSERVNGLLRKYVDGAKFVREHTYWSIPYSSTLQAITLFKKAKVYIKIDKELQKDFNLDLNGKTAEEQKIALDYKNNHPSYKTKSNYNTDYLKLKLSLYPYQVAGLEYAINKEGRVLLGDDMGLGKTAQGIAIAKHYEKDYPVIVLAPSSLLFNWKKEIMNWIDIDEKDVTVLKTGKDKPKGLFSIASYNYAIKNVDVINQYLNGRGILIVDEAHAIKNHQSKRTKAIQEIAHVAKRAVLISGTPFLSRPIEIFPLLNSINPKHAIWSNYMDFGKRYCEGNERILKVKTKGGKTMDRKIFMVSGASRIEEFHNLVRDEVMVRRLKSDEGVLDQLPEKIRVTQYFETDEKDTRQIKELINGLKTQIIKAFNKFNGDEKEVKKMVFNALSSSAMEDDIFEAYRLAGKAKLDSVKNWIVEKLDGEIDKLIIFGHHKEFLDGIERSLIEHKIKYMKIDGSTSKIARFNNTENFQKDPTIRVALLSINAASVGLTLTAASSVLMGELPWTPALAQQAEARAHRNGQLSIVNCYYAIANETLDGYLWNMISQKSSVISSMLDGGFGDEMELSFSPKDFIDQIIMDVKKDYVKK